MSSLAAVLPVHENLQGSKHRTEQRRFEDKVIGRWKWGVLFGFTHCAVFLLGQLVSRQSDAEIRAIITSLAGGIMASVTIGVPLAFAAVSSWQNIAKARAEEIAELKSEINQIKDEHARKEAMRDAETKAAKAEADKERGELKQKLSQLEHMVEDLLTENGLLRNALGRRNDAPNKRILFVDDNPDTCTLYRFLLMGEGYEVTTALSAIEGLKAYEEHRKQGLPYAAAILDFSMPLLSGEEAINIIHTFGDTKIKVALYTGHNPDALADFITRHPDVPVWQKTIPNDVFLKNVRELVGG